MLILHTSLGMRNRSRCFRKLSLRRYRAVFPAVSFMLVILPGFFVPWRTYSPFGVLTAAGVEPATLRTYESSALPSALRGHECRMAVLCQSADLCRPLIRRFSVSSYIRPVTNRHTVPNTANPQTQTLYTRPTPSAANSANLQAYKSKFHPFRCSFGWSLFLPGALLHGTVSPLYSFLGLYVPLFSSVFSRFRGCAFLIACNLSK